LFFLEMNTRLQVEHPVTEEVTGLDLIELMLLVAAGGKLPDLTSVPFNGHALEARITAEDASAGFVPAVGEVAILDVPDGVRWESALEVGVQVTPDYDAMIAKLIVHGDDRAAALANMRFALDHLLIAGVTTTTGFHRWLVDQAPVVDATVTTRFLDETEVPEPPPPPIVPAARMIEFLSRPAVDSVWTSAADFSVMPRAGARIIGMRDANGEIHEVALAPEDRRDSLPVDGWAYVPGLLAFSTQGHTHWFEVLDRTELWAPSAGDRAGTGNALVAPFPAAVAEVHVASGDDVAGDQVLVVIEAMKMLHSLKADGAATVDEVLVAVGDQVASNQPLVTFTPQEEESPS